MKAERVALMVEMIVEMKVALMVVHRRIKEEEEEENN